jgi:hypothetical protein
MLYFRLTIRYILIIGAALSVISLIVAVFDGSSHALYFAGIYSFCLELPAIALLLLVSVFNYVLSGSFWSVFKTEYNFLFARLGIYLLSSLIYFIADQLKR